LLIAGRQGLTKKGIAAEERIPAGFFLALHKTYEGLSLLSGKWRATKGHEVVFVNGYNRGVPLLYPFFTGIIDHN